MGDEVCTVRTRQAADLVPLAAMLVRVHAADGYPVEGVDDPVGWLENPDELQSWTAEIDGTPAGQVTLTKATPGSDVARVWSSEINDSVATLAILARLFVDPDWRHLGAGKLLIQTALDYGRSLGRSVALDVMEKDRAAIQLYQKLGARSIGGLLHRHGDGLTEPAVVFAFPATTDGR